MLGSRPALVLLLAAAVLSSAAAAAPPTSKKKGKVVGGPSTAPRPDDVQYIKCQVCQLLAKNAWRQVKELKKASTPSNPTDENKLIELMEKITTAWRPEGEWITKLDLVEEGDRLLVKEMDQVGNCASECKTIQLAADKIMGEHDTDIAELLFTGKVNRAQFNRWLCWEQSQACSKDPPPLPKNRAPGPPFDPKKEGDQSIDAMLGGLESHGLANNKKVREELMEKLGVKEKEEDDEDDESPEAMLKRAMKQFEAENGQAKPEAAQDADDAEDDEDDEGWEEL